MAIAAVHGHVQVVARAGSGKTATLINRALFLLKHCGVAPSEMLLLAFNRKAVLEMRRRLLGLLSEVGEAAVTADVDRRIREVGKHKRIDTDKIEANTIDAIAKQLNVTLPHVMTFHALAYAIVHPEESLLYNGSEGESQGLSRVFQQVIDDYLQVPAVKQQIRQLMLAHFREDWDRIVEGCYDKSKDELLQFRRSLPRESLEGEPVKSFGEKVIADFLFEHDIAYKYERNHWWSGINYRPDFTIFQTSKSGTIIEYFGLTGDPDYDEMSEEKRAYWDAKKDWTLIELSRQDIVAGGKESFIVLLRECLEAQGIHCVRLSEDEIWHRVRHRAIDRFTMAMVGFIGRCRKLSLSPAELRSLIESYSPLSPVEEMFLELAHRLYAAYLDRLGDWRGRL
ncbi:MAG: UvrD-helicase domain-containing protein [Pseudomonadota bacterium]|nr:UvrD-helicase domain-containing protein [Pseudomonadota bacterium]